MLNTIIGKRMQSKPVYARHLCIYISLRHVPEAHLNKQNKNAGDQITSLLLIHCYDEQEMLGNLHQLFVRTRTVTYFIPPDHTGNSVSHSQRT